MLQERRATNVSNDPLVTFDNYHLRYIKPVLDVGGFDLHNIVAALVLELEGNGSKNRVTLADDLIRLKNSLSYLPIETKPKDCLLAIQVIYFLMLDFERNDMAMSDESLALRVNSIRSQCLDLLDKLPRAFKLATFGGEVLQ